MVKIILPDANLYLELPQYYESLIFITVSPAYGFSALALVKCSNEGGLRSCVLRNVGSSK
jgi:hypothetical protein